MSYASRENLIDAFGEQELIQLTDRVNNGLIDSAVLARAIADADGEIDSYIGARYGQMLAGKPVPANLVRIGCDLARYRLYDDHYTDAVRQRYEDAIAYLRDVACGKAALGDDAVDASVNRSAGVVAHSESPVFTRHRLRDYLGGLR